MLTPWHIPLPQRKVLAARLVLFEALLPREFEVWRTRSSASELRQILQNLQAETERILTDPAPGDASGDLVPETAATLSALARRTRSPALRALLERYRSEADRRTCSECRAGKDPPAPCDGRGSDSITVGEHGRCLAGIRSLFDQVGDLAASSYAEHCAFRDRPAVVLCTMYTNAKPHEVECPYMASAATGRTYGGGRRVRLDVCVAQFDNDTYLSLLYVLAHEFISHVYCGLLAPRDVITTEHSPFSEGWMDFVAVEILRRAAVAQVRGTRGSRSRRGAGRFIYPDQLREGRDFHAARCSQRSAAAGAANRALGARTADLLLQLFMSFGDEKRARDAFLRLSLSRNLEDDGTSRNDAFVYRLASLLGDGTRPARTLDSAAGAYLRHGDPLRFTSSLE